MAVAELSQDADEPRDQRIRGARDYGLAKMLEAQYPNGAWPQRYDGVPKLEKDFPVLSAKIPNEWPREWPRTDYKWHYTLNDNTLADCIAVMLEAHRRYGMAEHLAAAKRAGDFLLLAQLPEPQAAWAQQYDTRMHPAWARAFEPPAVTASESAGAVRTLIDLFIETGEGKFLDAVPRVIAWWGLVQIAPSRWARFYELGSNRPIYGDRDGRIHYRLDEISEERRSGYAWEGEFGVSSAIRAYEEVLTEGREVLLKKRERGTLSDQDKTARARELESRVREVIEALDPEGRWVTKGTLSAKDPREESSDYVETRMFIRNLGVLSDYLEVARGE